MYSIGGDSLTLIYSLNSKKNWPKGNPPSPPEVVNTIIPWNGYGSSTFFFCTSFSSGTTLTVPLSLKQVNSYVSTTFMNGCRYVCVCVFLMTCSQNEKSELWLSFVLGEV